MKSTSFIMINNLCGRLQYLNTFIIKYKFVFSVIKKPGSVETQKHNMAHATYQTEQCGTRSKYYICWVDCTWSSHGCHIVIMVIPILERTEFILRRGWDSASVISHNSPTPCWIPMLNPNQFGSVALSLDQYHMKYSSYQFVNCVC